MDRVLLDTQAVYLAYRGELGTLSREARLLLEDPETTRFISSVSVTEIAVKHTIGKLDMSGVRLREAINDLELTHLPFEARHAMEMFSLPLHHRDPFDRMILAMAVAEELPIVTADRVFRRYTGVRVIW